MDLTDGNIFIPTDKIISQGESKPVIVSTLKVIGSTSDISECLSVKGQRSILRDVTLVTEHFTFDCRAEHPLLAVSFHGKNIK